MFGREGVGGKGGSMLWELEGKHDGGAKGD